jgi:hypothetical protein
LNGRAGSRRLAYRGISHQEVDACGTAEICGLHGGDQGLDLLVCEFVSD